MNQINELIHFHRIKVWNNLHCVHGRGNFRVLLPYVRQEWHSEERGQEGKGVQYNKHESTPTEHHFSRKDSKSKLARKKLFFFNFAFPPFKDLWTIHCCTMNDNKCFNSLFFKTMVFSIRITSYAPRPSCKRKSMTKIWS